MEPTNPSIDITGYFEPSAIMHYIYSLEMHPSRPLAGARTTIIFSMAKGYERG